jgi:hypothetical protein
MLAGRHRGHKADTGTLLRLGINMVAFGRGVALNVRPNH